MIRIGITVKCAYTISSEIKHYMVKVRKTGRWIGNRCGWTCPRISNSRNNGFRRRDIRTRDDDIHRNGYPFVVAGVLGISVDLDVWICNPEGNDETKSTEADWDGVIVFKPE